MIQEFPNEADNAEMDKWIFDEMQKNLDILLEINRNIQPALARWWVPKKIKLKILQEILNRAALATFMTATIGQVSYWISECTSKAVKESTSKEALALAMSFALKLHTEAPSVDHGYILECLGEVDIHTKEGITSLLDKITNRTLAEMAVTFANDTAYKADKIKEMVTKFLSNPERKEKFTELLCT